MGKLQDIKKKIKKRIFKKLKIQVISSTSAMEFNPSNIDEKIIREEIINGIVIKCYYWYFNKKVYVYDKRKETDILKIDKRLRKYDISKYLNMAKKEKLELDYTPSIEGGDALYITLSAKRGRLPVIDITLSSGGKLTTARLEKDTRMYKRNIAGKIKSAYIEKNIIRTDDFYELYADKLDLSKFDKNPCVHLFFNINKDVFVKIWGKKNVAERIARKIKEEC